MAPALAQTPLLSWRGEDVALKEVVEELHKLEAGLARSEARTPDEQPFPRTSSMNMIAISSDEESSLRAARVLDRIAIHHPSRVIVLELGEAEATARIDAQVLVGAQELTAGVFSPFERILLKVSGEAADHVATLVEPFLQPDLPTHVWWMGDPPLHKPRLLDTVPMCATLLVDSSAFARPFESFAIYSDLVRSLPDDIGVEDLHWMRLRPWREMLAQFFGSSDTLPLLKSIRGIGVDYSGEGRGNRVLVALFVGWLASALGWNLRRAAAGPDGRMLAELSARDGRLVEIGCQSRSAAGLDAGDILAIRLHAEGDFGRGSIVAERDDQKVRNVRIRMDVSGKRLERVVVLDDQQEPDLLVQALISQGQDAVYQRSLKLAAELMKSLR